MKNYKIVITLCLTLLLLAGLIAGCSTKTAETPKEPAGNDAETTVEPTSETKYKDEVIIGVPSNPTTFDPHSSTAKAMLRVTVNIYETLFEFDVDTKEVKPKLVKSWEMPADNEYIFYLRDDVKFHNGNPMTVNDVVYSLQRCIDMPAANTFVMAIDKMEAIDDYTLKVTLKEPSPTFLNNLTNGTVSIIPEGSGDTINENPIGTGPFKFVEYAVDDYVLLERTDNYWGEQSPTKRIRIRIIPDHNARNMAVEAGDIDISIQIYSVDYTNLKMNDDIVVHKEPSVQVEYLAMNTQEVPFDDVHARRAVAYALNVNGVVEDIYAGDVAIAKSFVSSEVIGYNDNVKTYEYNIEKAKEELAKSKYPEGFEFTLYTTKSRARYTEALQYDLSVIGITMNVEFVQNVQSAIMGGYKGGHITGITYDSFDIDGAYRYLHSDSVGAGGNLTWYSNPKMDELLGKTRTEMDPVKRAQVVSDIQDLLYEDVPMVPLFARISTSGYVKGTQGYRPAPNEVDVLVNTYVEIQE